MLGLKWIAKQVRSFDTQGRCKLHQNLNRWIARTAFDVADISPVDISLKGIFFLAPALGRTQALQIGAKDLAYIHLQCIARMSTINLQTISDKMLDWPTAIVFPNDTYRLQGPLNEL